MNIQSFIEKFILRDIIAIILPGCIVLLGTAFIIQAYGNNTWYQAIEPLLKQYEWFVIILVIFLAFIIGHIIDFIYRIIFQSREWYKRYSVIQKELTDNNIRQALSSFLGINLNDEDAINALVSSKQELSKITFFVRYWIEQENSQIYDTEIDRPAIQAHFLNTSGISFILFGLCVSLSLIWDIGQVPSMIPKIALSCASFMIGCAAIAQGLHKRQVFVTHIYRVFFILWNASQK